MILDIKTLIFYYTSMTKTRNVNESCKSAGGSFPVVATVTGVASCFAQSLLHKHVDLGSGLEVLLAVSQAVPFALVLRYFGTRLRARSGLTSAHQLR